MLKLAAGNWKMNGTPDMLDGLAGLARDGVDVLICPPATLIAQAARGAGATMIGGQDCHAAPAGAHTGDVSATMLHDAGATHVILGHSERRADHDESNDAVRAKVAAAHGADLTAIVCIGETLAEREAGDTLGVLDAQLAASLPDGCTASDTVVAYEPVWAIGTGLTATTDQIAQVHAHLRARLANRFATGADMRLLYGGSVKAGNAAEIFAVPNVDGALVGGASLSPDDFAPIVAALARA